MAEKGTLYVDLLSQPCRALALLVRQAKLSGNVKEKSISLLKGTDQVYEREIPFTTSFIFDLLNSS